MKCVSYSGGQIGREIWPNLATLVAMNVKINDASFSISCLLKVVLEAVFFFDAWFVIA